MSNTLLKVDNLHVYYGSIHAIKGVSFEVNEGEIVTLIGANGAGKSTTLNTIAGLLKPHSGSIMLHDQNIVEQNAQMALSIADRAYVLETGKIVNEGSASDLLHDDSVRRAYLGN